ncbi:MAG: acyltransferase domain-containing protein, partial [Chloroflexales bacterium]|nr:acyltransferase domain-containing protein [Chloroflexales bacterium]
MTGNETASEQLSPVKRALLEIRDLRARLRELEQAGAEPVAVVGVGLRFPGGADSPGSFWQLLRDGVDAITQIPASRWDVDAYYSPGPAVPGKMSSRGGGFVADVDQFEPQFFGIPAREALSTDPQQRLLLEVAWEALERAGRGPDELKGSQVGVFIGITNSDYGRLMLTSPEDIDAYFATGSSFSVAAGRLAYTLGLHGPCMAIDTACSSSLVAVHQACMSLRARECGLALAGGVNLILSPEAHITLSQAQMMAADDRCKTFDASADGYVRGEGAAVVVLQRLSDAIAERMPILALIRGSAVNHDGRSNGLTAPSGHAQRAVLRQALANAHVQPHLVDFVEAHGTGTPLGDPIEVQALAEVYGEQRPPERPLLIGSVKTNLGHLESAAGIAGLIKAVLALQHAQIPPHLHFTRPNPYIDWGAIPVAVASRLTDWPSDGRPRIAGVSSFGFSGTNAHLIVEEAPPLPKVPAPEPAERHLLALSAQTQTALYALASRYAAALGQAAADPAAYADACFTASVGRAHFPHRLAVLAESAPAASAALGTFLEGRLPPEVAYGDAPAAQPLEVAFLFTGQGAQYPGMGRQLYAREPIFRQALDRCAQLLRPHLAQPLTEVLFAHDPATAALLHQTAYTQPAL